MSQRSPPAFHQKPDVPKEKEQHSNPSHDHAAKAAKTSKLIESNRKCNLASTKAKLVERPII